MGLSGYDMDEVIIYVIVVVSWVVGMLVHMNEVLKEEAGEDLFGRDCD
jgi:hypothetical protein